MNKNFILKSLTILSFLGLIVLLLNFAIKKQEPPKGYRIKIREVVYFSDTYFLDGEYIVFRDELGRDVEVHKNFVSVEEVK